MHHATGSIRLKKCTSITTNVVMLTYCMYRVQRKRHPIGMAWWPGGNRGFVSEGPCSKALSSTTATGEDLKTRPASSYTNTATPPHLNPTSPPRLPLLSTLLYSRLSTHTALAVDEAHPAMLSRFAPRAAAAPRALRFAPVARRNVTTDAASAHVDKSEVPTVRLFQEENEHIGVICTTRG
jgi:hypothetical protein